MNLFIDMKEGLWGQLVAGETEIPFWGKPPEGEGRLAGRAGIDEERQVPPRQVHSMFDLNLEILHQSYVSPVRTSLDPILDLAQHGWSKAIISPAGVAPTEDHE